MNKKFIILVGLVLVFTLFSITGDMLFNLAYGVSHDPIRWLKILGLASYSTATFVCIAFWEMLLRK
jgi:hypothetical protein